MSDITGAGLSIESIVAPADAPKLAGDAAKVRRERQSWEKVHLRKLADLRRQSFAQDIAERRSYAGRIYNLICAWLATTLALLLLVGFNLGGFSLPEKVMLALIGGTTFNVLALFVIVATYLFPRVGGRRSRRRSTRRS